MSWAAAVAALNEKLRDTFPTSCVYTPAATSVARTINAIHDVEHVLVDGGNGSPVSAQITWLDVVLSDLAAVPVQGDAVTVASVAYTVGHAIPDGQGMSRLHLLKA